MRAIIISSFIFILIDFSVGAAAFTHKGDNIFKKAGKAIEKGVQDTGNAIEKGAQDAGKAIEKGAHDTGKTLEKAAQDAGKAIEKGAHDTGKAIEKGAHDVGGWIDDFFLEFCKIMTGSRDPQKAQEQCNVNVGYSCDDGGTCYAYDPQNPDEKYELGNEDKGTNADPAAFSAFVNSISQDPSEVDVVQDGFVFENIWVEGIKASLTDWAAIGDSVPNFVPPNETGLIRGSDAYASTGGSFLSLRSSASAKVKYYHGGIDYVMQPNSPVLAGANGTLIKTGCAYCGRGGAHQDLYRTVWVKADSGNIIRYLYVSPSTSLKQGARVEAGKTVLGTAQDLSLRYPPKSSGGMTNHVHVQITDRDNNWVSPDGKFEVTRKKNNINRAGDYFDEELLRIQGMLNDLNDKK